jgi:cell wall-associated NlpC family hydrolase
MIATRQQLMDIARSYIDVPFHHQGRSRGGLDCIGLIVVPAQTLGIVVKDQKGYSRQANPMMLRHHMGDSLDRIGDDLSCAVPGDILLFHADGHPDIPLHVGLLTEWVNGGYGLLHAYYDNGRVTETNLDDHWKPLLHSVWSYRWPQ